MNQANKENHAGCPVAALSDTFKLSNETLDSILKHARSDSPVAHIDDIGYWAVSRYDDIRTILSDKENFSAEITLEPLTPYSPEVLALLKSRGFSPRPTLSNNEAGRPYANSSECPGSFPPATNGQS